MAVIGYARVSSRGQSLELQLEALKAEGCTKVFSEKRSGLDGARPELAKALDYAREGDTIVITRLDRLARSTGHLYGVYEGLKAKGVGLKVLAQKIDTASSGGKLLFGMLAIIAEFEADIRKERQLEGIAKAKADGVAFGRQPTLTAEQVIEMRKARKGGTLIKDLMKRYDLSKASIYRLLDTGDTTPPEPVRKQPAKRAKTTRKAA
jgi:DNA invertase Pin-like site-specific DNA recombinase